MFEPCYRVKPMEKDELFNYVGKHMQCLFIQGSVTVMVHDHTQRV